MALILEDVESRGARLGVERSDRVLKYSVYETEDEDEVEALVEATLPAFYKGLAFQSYETEYHGGFCWKVIANYGTRPVKEIGQSSFSFDTTGGTTHITQSKESTPWTGGEDTEIDNHKCINVKKDDVAGVDITIPKFAFSVTRVIADPLPTAYANALESLTGKVNVETVNLNISGVQYTFDFCELLFLGASGGKRGNDAWEITLRFEVSRSATLDFDLIINVFKPGWEYLWIQYEDVEETQKLTAKPRQVNVEKVYDAADLRVLFM